MTVLHNLISNKELKRIMLAEKDPRITVSFYKYFYIPIPQYFRNALYISLTKLKVFGRIYVAHEGINAQISVPKDEYEKFKKVVHNFHPSLNNLRMNIALDDNGKSFWVLRLKVRNRILADGINDNNFDINNVGKYLEASEVNTMMNDDDTIFVDMRNYYEYEIGHFENAIQIPADTFREQLMKVIEILKEKKDKKIVMYCTGGIRCEKASAWMKYNGFSKVYQIEGGIIEYIRQARQQKLPVFFRGKMFVFDERMGERISNDIISNCHQCGVPCDVHTNCTNNNCHLMFIQCEKCAKKYHHCCGLFCMRNYIFIPKQTSIITHKNNNYLFNKSHNLLNKITTNFFFQKK